MPTALPLNEAHVDGDPTGHTQHHNDLAHYVNTAASHAASHAAAGGDVVTPAAIGAAAAVQLGPSSGADDTATLNGVLAASAGLRVRGLPGQTYLISAPLVVYSGTELDMTGCTVSAAGTTHRMLQNASYGSSTTRDSDITLVGGTWSAGAVNGDTHRIALHRVDRLKIRDLRMVTVSGKYAIFLTDVTVFEVRGVDFAASSDGLHVTGPASSGNIRDLTGSTGDDFCALGTTDYAQYELSTGDLRDIVVDGLRPSAGPGCFHIFGETGEVSGIVVRNAGGTVTGVGGSVRIGDPGISGASFTDIRVEGVDPIPVADMPLVQIYDAVDVTVRDVCGRRTGGVASLVRVETGATVQRLAIEGVVDTTARAPQGLVEVQGTVTDLLVRGVRFTTGAGARVVNISGAVVRGTLTEFAGVGAKSDLDMILYVGPGAGGSVIAMSNVRTSNFYYPIWVAADVQITLLGVDFDVCTATVFLDGSAADLTIGGAAIRSAPTYRAVQVNSTGVARFRTIDFPVDLELDGVSAGDNDRAYNTNATLACGAGPVICNGTSWKHLYTGDTYTP